MYNERKLPDDKGHNRYEFYTMSDTTSSLFRIDNMTIAMV